MSYLHISCNLQGTKSKCMYTYINSKYINKNIVASIVEALEVI